MPQNFLFTDANGDYTEAVGFETADHIDSSTGVADAGKPIILNADGKIDPTMISFDSLTWKQPARVASTADVTIATAPAAIDGVTLNNGDRVLLKDQAIASQNGIYDFNGVGVAMTRSSDFDEDSEVVAGTVVAVEEGTDNADRIYLVTSDNPLIVDTDPITFGLMPVNTFSAGDGIDINGSNVISVDLLDSGSGLCFAGS